MIESFVRLDESGHGASFLDRERDQYRLGRRQHFVVALVIVIGGIESPFDRTVATVPSRPSERDLLLVVVFVEEERDEESARPTGSEDQEIDLVWGRRHYLVLVVERGRFGRFVGRVRGWLRGSSSVAAR